MQPDGESLGNLEEAFKPGSATICAGVTLGLVLVIGGVGFAGGIGLSPPRRNETTGDRVGKYTAMAFSGILVPLAGVMLLLHARELATHGVLLYENGFEDLAGRTKDICFWKDVTEIREVFTHEELEVLHFPGAKIKNVAPSFIVLRSDGKTFDFNPDAIDRFTRFGNWLKYFSEQFEIPWRKIIQSE